VSAAPGSGAPPLQTADPRAGYLAERAAIDAAIRAVLEGGHWVLGPAVEAFERGFAAFLGVAHGVGTGSGTDALHLALRALGVGAGDEVITVSHTAVATVAAIEMAGARPVLVDVEPGTGCMDVAAAAAAVGPRTRAVVPVHLYGQPVDVEAVAGLCRARGLALVEDCAQAAGALWQGRRLGSFGDAAAFSFYPTKNLAALGDGGLVATRDAALAARVRRLRQYGWDEPQHSLEPGWNSRLDALQAAVLAARLPRLDANNDRRRALAARYRAALAGLPLALPDDRAGGRHVYHLHVVRAADRATRDALRAHLAARGIRAGVHYPAGVHQQPAYAGRLATGPLPATEALATTVLSLPLYPELAEADQDRVVAAVRGFFGGTR
jgi:dTDP-4-amino-4,6-dideoxygalactose transaminase